LAFRIIFVEIISTANCHASLCDSRRIVGAAVYNVWGVWGGEAVRYISQANVLLICWSPSSPSFADSIFSDFQFFDFFRFFLWFTIFRRCACSERGDQNAMEACWKGNG